MKTTSLSLIIIILFSLVYLSSCLRKESELCDIGPSAYPAEMILFACAAAQSVPRRYSDETEAEYEERVQAQQNTFRALCLTWAQKRQSCLNNASGYYIGI